MTTISPSFAVRVLGPVDHGAWERLFRAYFTFYETERPQFVLDAAWAKIVAGVNPHGFGAHLNGRLVGFTHYLFHETTWDPKPCCYLQDLYVAEDARGSGAARALIKSVYAAADARGVSQVYWLTQDFNARARALYDKVATRTPFIKYRR